MTLRRNIHRNGAERMRKPHSLLAVLVLLLAQSCFTGVESTPKIGNAEVKQKNAATQTAEQLYLADIAPQPLKNWRPGKQFLITNPKIALIFQPNGATFNTADTLIYKGLKEIPSPTGTATNLLFTIGNNKDTVVYRLNDAPQTILSRPELEVPFTIDLDLIESVAQRLAGNKYFVLTPRWNDAADNITTRLKYIPVRIIEVAPGNEEFPIKVKFQPESPHNPEGAVYSLYMTPTNNKHSTRNFDNLFSITDPRRKYPSITDHVWDNIINNRIETGMTRDEVRLALGSPNDVDRGHDYSSVYERWNYDGGIYLIFRDGLLETFRR